MLVKLMSVCSETTIRALIELFVIIVTCVRRSVCYRELVGPSQQFVCNLNAEQSAVSIVVELKPSSEDPLTTSSCSYSLEHATNAHFNRDLLKVVFK